MMMIMAAAVPAFCAATTAAARAQAAGARAYLLAAPARYQALWCIDRLRKTENRGRQQQNILRAPMNIPLSISN